MGLALKRRISFGLDRKPSPAGNRPVLYLKLRVSGRKLHARFKIFNAQAPGDPGRKDGMIGSKPRIRGAMQNPFAVNYRFAK